MNWLEASIFKIITHLNYNVSQKSFLKNSDAWTREGNKTLGMRLMRRAVALVGVYAIGMAFAATLMYAFTQILVWPPESQKAGLDSFLQTTKTTILRLATEDNRVNLGFLQGVLGVYATLMVATLFSDKNFFDKIRSGPTLASEYKDVSFMEGASSSALIRPLSTSLTLIELVITFGAIHGIISKQVKTGFFNWEQLISVDTAVAVTFSLIVLYLRAALDGGSFGLQSSLRSEIVSRMGIDDQYVLIKSWIRPPWVSAQLTDVPRGCICFSRKELVLPICFLVVFFTMGGLASLLWLILMCAWILWNLALEAIYPFWNQAPRGIKWMLRLLMGVILFLFQFTLVTSSLGEGAGGKLLNWLSGIGDIAGNVGAIIILVLLTILNIGSIIFVVKKINCGTKESQDFMNLSFAWIKQKRGESDLRISSLRRLLVSPELKST